MNQILVNQKVYVTPKLKRKKTFYKIQFVLSILAVIILTSYYAYSEYDKRKNAAIGKDIMADFAGIDGTIIDDDTLVVLLDNQENATVEQIEQEPQILDQFNTVYTAPSGHIYNRLYFKYSIYKH